MVLSKAASTSKRKKTTDMPESPPKRVTRARAKKAAGDAESQLKVTKIVTESAKASAQSRRQTAPAKATKRKTRADDENGDLGVEILAEEPKREVMKKQTRQKKSKDETSEYQLKVEIPTTRARSVVPDKITVEAPKPRGRPKKVAIMKAPASTEVKEQEDPEPAKNLRGRSATVEAKRRTAISTAKMPATRKKVNFQLQDEPEKDKENVPLPTKASEMVTLKATGLKAKPIRKPASTKPTTRCKKTEKDMDEEVHPLSPKKATQVAKSSSINSEDELGSEKTPVRPLSRSPVKPPMSAIWDVEKTISNIDFGTMRAPSSPESTLLSNPLGSPARRPPPSPFKDALKESPKRVKLGDSIANASSMAPHSPTKASLLKSPARRLAISTAPLSSMKVSLLQTPARRIAVSPIRFNATSSPQKSNLTLPAFDVVTASKLGQNSVCSQLSPEQAISSPLRVSKSPSQPIVAKEINDTEQEAEFNFKISSTPVQLNENSTPVQGAVDFAADARLVLNISPSPAQTMESPLSMHAPENQIDAFGKGTGFSPSGAGLQPPVFPAKGFWFAPPSLRSAAEESDSEDELSTGHKPNAPTPLFDQGITSYSNTSASTLAMTKTEAKYIMAQEEEMVHSGVQWSPIPKHRVASFSLTPLATKLSAWRASSPAKKTPSEPSERKRGLFSPAGPTLFDRPEENHVLALTDSPSTFSFFEDGIAARDEDGNETTLQYPGIEERCVEAEASQDSQVSEQYGDENAIPIDPQLHTTELSGDELSLVCTPQRVFSSQTREIHTVSKVPLRPAGDESPLDLPRTRSRSLGGPLTDIKASQEYYNGCNNIFLPAVQDTSILNEVASENPMMGEPATPKKFNSELPQTPSTGVFSNFGSPLRTARKGAVPNVLKGAVVYVDVHTTEGADASGIFLDLLTQMGARCVKQWLWNPRCGTGCSGDDTTKTSPDCGTPSSKVGITHVVFKDGGKRTLEKVREAKGVVLCVGVGWVLDCEREDRWLDESAYAVDTSLVPRGGHNRRKSMEPRALFNLNGNLIPADQTPAKSPSNLSPSKDFVPFDTPASRRDTFIIQQPRTPVTSTPVLNGADSSLSLSSSQFDSPTTPYYLSRGAHLVQQTCPPKQTGQLLFPVSGNIADQPDEGVRQRLQAARRKSLQWQPKVSSPLGRAVSYGGRF